MSLSYVHIASSFIEMRAQKKRLVKYLLSHSCILQRSLHNSVSRIWILNDLPKVASSQNAHAEDRLAYNW